MSYFRIKDKEKIPPEDMSYEEFFSIARELEEYGAVFSELWRMGIPIFANNYSGRSIKTLEVHFDQQDRGTKIYINPFLWKKLSNNQKLFLICHECLHVIFNYSFRIKGMDSASLANQAADVAINQILVENFMFDRNKIDVENELCWQDNGLYEKIKNVEPLQTMEYYYNLIGKELEGSDGQLNGDGEGGSNDGFRFIIGNHGNSKNEDNNFEEICERLNNILSPEEKKSIKKLIEKHFNDEENSYSPGTPGNSKGNIWTFIEKEAVEPKKKWETVIKKWASFQIRDERREVEQWVILNRRFSLLPRNLLIPSEREIESLNKKKNKIKVWFFQDTSGSCREYAKRFFKAAESLPKKRFDVKMHCFDTKVYETTLESRKLYGFGGTRFDIIEDYIIRNSNNKEDYPKTVFVISDGWGNAVYPKYPDRWYIFLSPEGIKDCFPNECNFFNLEDFE